MDCAELSPLNPLSSFVARSFLCCDFLILLWSPTGLGCFQSVTVLKLAIIPLNSNIATFYCMLITKIFICWWELLEFLFIFLEMACYLFSVRIKKTAIDGSCTVFYLSFVRIFIAADTSSNEASMTIGIQLYLSRILWCCHMSIFFLIIILLIYI